MFQGIVEPMTKELTSFAPSTRMIKRVLGLGMDWLSPQFGLCSAMPERVDKRVEGSVAASMSTITWTAVPSLSRHGDGDVL